MEGRGRARGRLGVAAGLLAAWAPVAWAQDPPVDLQGEASGWVAAPAAGVALALAPAVGEGGAPAVRLEWDFQGRAGWAAARRPAVMELPANWELRFRVRGEGRANHLEVKFADGENVWWSVRRDFVPPADWQWLRVKRRQAGFAWGPAGGGEIERFAAVELAVTAGEGGTGWIEVAGLELVPRPPERPYAGTPRAEGSGLPGFAVGQAVDGRPETAWRAGEGESELVVDFGEPREFDGLALVWEEGRAPVAFTVEVAEVLEERVAAGAASSNSVIPSVSEGAGRGERTRTDREAFAATSDWRPVWQAERAGAPVSELFLPETETRFLRLRARAGAAGVGLAEIEVRPLGWAPTANAFFERLAAQGPRGAWPRSFSGEQAYWTVVGVDGGAEEALVSEDGAVELGDGGPSLEPFLFTGGRLRSWADAEIGHRLEDGDLPIPTVSWTLPGLRLEITTLAVSGADGEEEPGRERGEGNPPAGRGPSALLVRYRLTNSGAEAQVGRLLLAARPFQVNPPTQFLNRVGGVRPISRLACGKTGLTAEGVPVLAAPFPESCGVAAFDEGPLGAWLDRGEPPPQPEAPPGFRHPSALLTWSYSLPPGAGRTWLVAVPFQPEGTELARRLVTPPRISEAFERALAGERSRWREKLDRVRFTLPAAAEPLAETVRSSLAFVLVHRDGPAIQPGSRAYARSWIRDGALTGSALVRLGHGEAAREFAEWFGGFQYPDGTVPCCVDRRGADPVPEHDSHGEWIHLVREVFRATGDRAFAERMLPGVVAAAEAIDRLRGERRGEAWRTAEKLPFFGLLPPSISHEGYSARPVHSYWDDGFAVLGLADAAALAADLGRADLAARFAASADELRADLLASIARVRERAGVAYLPGSADLADFDSTSTTALLDPAGLQDVLPEEAVAATFDRYLGEFRRRRDAGGGDGIYTPYELRHVGAFVRLGRREVALELLDFFVADRRPAAWNQWAEVVDHRAPRRPRFLGDMPHGWVATDFVRSFLDLFACERPTGGLALAAGIPGSWLDGGEPVGIAGLVTPWGALTYRLQRIGAALEARIEPLAALPPEGIRFDPPWPAEISRRVLVDGVEVAAVDGPIVLRALPATVVLEPMPSREGR